MKNIIAKRTSLVIIWFSSFVIAVVGLMAIQPMASIAACDPNIGDGRATLSANVTGAARYTVWLRMKAPDTTNNSVLVNVGNDYCGQIVGDSNTTVNAWKWVQGPAMTVNLPVDATTDVVIGGREPGVSVDRLLLISDGCVPTDASKGDNCYDNTGPFVAVASPTDGATITTTSTTLRADGADPYHDTDADRGVSKIDFYVDNVLVGTDTTYASGTGWTYNWNSGGAGNGSHTIFTRNYDKSNNMTQAPSITVTVSIGGGGDTEAPTATPTFPFAAPSETLVNNIVVIRSLRQVVVTPGLADNVGVVSQSYKINGVTKTADGSGNIILDNKNGNYALAITAADAAGNVLNRTITVKVRHPDIVRDNAVNFDDFTRMLIQWGTTNPESDLSDNGIVDFDDFTKLLIAWTG